MLDLNQFAEKYFLALETSMNKYPVGGVCGLELEWNLLDATLHPLLTVGSSPGQQSFVDYLRSDCLPAYFRDYSQLEVFHWMIEWATRPYYHLQGAVFEGRLMEAVLINVLSRAGRQFDQRLYSWYGNLPYLTSVSHDSIPGTWPIAKRRYLERCVDLYGDSLATAGTHANLSLPDALLEWDFIHLPASERDGSGTMPVHLDEYKSQFYITATRLMRAFASVFIAVSASTPFQAGFQDSEPVVFLTNYDSVRNLTFPNPNGMDVPDLYCSYDDYLQISYDLVRRGIRFGNNNWTPVRARSFAEPVERLIAMTSDQLQDIYARGLYSVGHDVPFEETARQIEVQNLIARIDLPMARVEVRTDDGGHSLELDIANLTLKHLLLVWFYVDPQFARGFRYDQEDILRARRNEELAAREGLRAEIENPLTGKPIALREFLSWTLAKLAPLAEVLGVTDLLEPLNAMTRGAPNTSEQIRTWAYQELGVQPDGKTNQLLVPSGLLIKFAEQRERQVMHDTAIIAGTYPRIGGEAAKIGQFLQHAREDAHQDASVPIRFRPLPETVIEASYPDKTAEIVALAEMLIEIPSVTASPQERLEEVRRAGTFIYDYLEDHRLEVRFFNQAKYPAILANFPRQMQVPIMLCGHFDVVEPEPDDSQFAPRLEGDYLWGRGAADMKTVVATYLVWMKDNLRKGPSYPPFNLLLVGNEENGETEKMGSPHVLALLESEGYAPDLFIAGERTGERGDELWGEICTQNRGVMRFEVKARGLRSHSGVAGATADLTLRLIEARSAIARILDSHLTLSSPDGWQSQARFPFIQVGEPGVYNVTPSAGRLGVEVRPIPQDGLIALRESLADYCASQELELSISVQENGVACDPGNPYLVALIQGVRQASGSEPTIGRKLPGTSARFAPAGQGVVWGQSGIGPHARDERHYIPSILPYYRALNEYAEILKGMQLTK